MGTSTSHRSPATAEWDRVRELYLTVNPTPGEIVGRIVAALDDVAQQRFSDAAAVRCLDAVLAGSLELAEGGAAALVVRPGESAALRLAQNVRSAAQNRLGAEGVASVTGTLALEAIPPAVVEALGTPVAWPELPPETVASQYARFTTDQNLSDLSGQFLAHDLDRVFRYFVTRDLSDFVGESAAPTVADAARLVSGVGDFCRERAGVANLRQYEQDLQEIVRTPAERRPRDLEPLWRSGIQEGLAGLAGG